MRVALKEGARHYKNQLKQGIVRYGAIASGDTLRSVEVLENSKPNTLKEERLSASVLALQSLKYIQSGRAKGAKMPIRQVRVSRRGRKIFEPLPEMVRWFETVGIPKESWWAVLWSIKRRGIKPRDVIGYMERNGRMPAKRAVRRAAQRIAANFYGNKL
jgi:hypothetical protein